MTGLIFVGMLGPDSHNQEERRFVEELSANFTVSHYLRGAGIKGIRLHQLKSIPSRLRGGRLDHPTRIRARSLLLLPLRRHARLFNTKWIRRQLEDLLRGASVEWTLWVRFPSPELVDAIAQIQDVHVVYEPIDLYSAAEDLSATHSKLLIEAEDQLVRRATVVTGGRQLAERFKDAKGGSLWLPFGRDRRQPALSDDVPKDVSRPRLGLVGCLDWRVDESLLVSLMTEHPDWQLILAGPRINTWGSGLKRLPNVRWLGRIPVDRVRPLIRDCDVTLVPYRLTEWTRYCLPVKTFEYLAEGKPVVATPLPELALLRDVVTIATADSFAGAVSAALEDTSARASERRRVAADRFTLQDRARLAIKLLNSKELQSVTR